METEFRLHRPKAEVLAMTTYRPAPSRCMGSLVLTTIVTAAVAAGWAWGWSSLAFIERMDRAGRGPRTETEIILYGGLAVIAGMGLLCALVRLSLLRTRYEVGATEIVAHEGLLWRSTTTVPLVEVHSIETSSGPVQRLLGLSDLRIAGTVPLTMFGIPGAEGLKGRLLDRRDTLREAARSGDLPIGATTEEILQERLARAIERLERRLPGAGLTSP